MGEVEQASSKIASGRKGATETLRQLPVDGPPHELGSLRRRLEDA